jgi:ribosomal protein L32
MSGKLCPHCNQYKGYQVRDIAQFFNPFGFLALLVVLFWTVIFPLVWLFAFIKELNIPEDLYKCSNCGYQWHLNSSA